MSNFELSSGAEPPEGQFNDFDNPYDLGAEGDQYGQYGAADESGQSFDDILAEQLEGVEERATLAYELDEVEAQAVKAHEAEHTLDLLGYDHGFTPQELSFATRRAVDAHDEALRAEFPLAVPAEQSEGPVEGIDYKDVALGPVDEARVVLKQVSHEATVLAMPGRLDREQWLTHASERVEAEFGEQVSVTEEDSTGAAPLEELETDGEQGQKLGNVWESQLEAGREGDRLAYDRANTEPTGMTLQDAAVSLAGIRHAINEARAQSERDSTAEILTLRNAARWVTERTVAPPADMTTLARWYNFAIDESVNRRPDQPDPTQLQPAA